MESIVRREKDGGFVACAWDPAARWTAAIARARTEAEADARARAECSDTQRLGVVSATLLHPRVPGVTETYGEYLGSHGLLGGGFEYPEIYRPRSPRHLMPPATMWPGMVAVLASAHWVRTQLVAVGGHGLVIAAAHRLEGGAPKSKHKLNRALDLDLLSTEPELAERFLVVGARFYKMHAHLRCGVGSYHGKGTRATRRLHVDVGARRWRTCWQYHGATKIGSPAIASIARSMR